MPLSSRLAAPTALSLRNATIDGSWERALALYLAGGFALGVGLEFNASAFWGVNLGLVIAVCAAFLCAWVSMAGSKYFPIFSFPAVVFCSVLIAWCVISPLPTARLEGLPSTDRFNYYFVYYYPDIFSFSDQYEIGFLAFMSAARYFMSFQTFLVLCVCIALLGYLRMMAAAGAVRYFPFAVCLLIGYFSFWAGALNITRQFLAGGVMLMGAAFILRTDKPDFRNHLMCAGFGIAATLIHSSAGLLFIFQAAMLLERRERTIIILWGINFLAFIANFLEINPIRFVTGVVDRLQKYDVQQLSSNDLSYVISTGVGTGNRLDWAAFLLAPMFIYWSLVRSSKGASGGDVKIRKFALFYTVLTMPFYNFSFLIYADRLAYFAFLAIPMFILVLVGAPAMRSYRGAVLGMLACVAISQIAVGWYGYTPLNWANGLQSGLR